MIRVFEPLTANERYLALSAFAPNEDSRRWGNLVLETYDAAVRERVALEEALRETPEKWSFRTLVTIAGLILDREYPADVFTGESGDSGPRVVVRLREALADVHAALHGDPEGHRLA